MPAGGCHGGREALLPESMSLQLEGGLPRPLEWQGERVTERGSKQGSLSSPHMDLDRDLGWLPDEPFLLFLGQFLFGERAP